MDAQNEGKEITIKEGETTEAAKGKEYGNGKVERHENLNGSEERNKNLNGNGQKTNGEASRKLWNREYIKVMICNFLLFFAFYLLTPLLPLYLDKQFNADKSMIGLVLSGYVVATLLVRPFSGFVVDSFDRKTVLTICFFAFFICFTGYVGAGTLLMFAIVRTLHGIPFGATTVVNSTVAIDVLPSSRRNEGLGFYGLSNNIAMAVAPSAGIYIYHATDNFMLLFWLSLILAFGGFYCATKVKLPAREKVQTKPVLSLDHFFLGRAWLLAVNISFFGLCWGVMSNYVAIYGKTQLGITDGTGIFFMLLSAGLITSRHCRRTSLAGRLFAFRICCYRVELLSLRTTCRPRQRADVSCIPEYVCQGSAPQPARHGQLLDTDFVGPGDGHRHTARRRDSRKYRIFSGLPYRGVHAGCRRAALHPRHRQILRAASPQRELKQGRVKRRPPEIEPDEDK